MNINDFNGTANVCRQGIACNNGDKKLIQLFEDSIGKLAEFPRVIDFKCSVILSSKSPISILGETLTIDYHYKHLEQPSLTHPSLDWIGLSRVIGNFNFAFKHKPKYFLLNYEPMTHI